MLQYEPAGHCVGALAPAGQKEPAGQMGGVICGVEPAQYRPAEHGRHAVDCCPDMLPGGHGSGAHMLFTGQ